MNNHFPAEKTTYRWAGSVIICLALIVAVAGIAAQINLRHLWLDEAAVALLIQQPLIKLAEAAVVTGHSVLYAYLIAAWADLWGDSAIALRSFSSLWALGVIVMVYRVGRDILNHRRLALVAAVLASTNYFLLWFAVQAKPYTLAAFLGLLSFYLFHQFLRRRRLVWGSAYVVTMATALYVHPWLTLVFGAHLLAAVFWCWAQHRVWWLIIIAQLSVAILGIPNFIILWRQHTLGASAWIPPVTGMTFIETIKYFSYGHTWLYALLSGLALLSYAYMNYWQRAHRPSRLIFSLPYASLLCYLLVPLLTAWLASLVSPMYAVGRYEVIVLPAFILLLAAWWVNYLPGRWLSAFMILLLLINFVFLIKRDRDQVRSYASTDETIARYIISAIAPHDFILTTDLSWATMAYYLPRVNTPKTPPYRLAPYPAEISTHPGWQNLDAMIANTPRYANEAAELADELHNDSSVQHVWVVYRASNPLNAILIRQLSAYFVIDNTYQPPPPRPPAWFDAVIKLTRKTTTYAGN